MFDLFQCFFYWKNLRIDRSRPFLPCLLNFDCLQCAFDFSSCPHILQIISISFDYLVFFYLDLKLDHFIEFFKIVIDWYFKFYFISFNLNFMNFVVF